jgi:phenylalanyl-tRNA synthetase alpha chain
MLEDLKQLKDKALKEFKKITDSEMLFKIEKKYLGRQGELANLAKKVKDVVDDQKPEVGKLLNEVKQTLGDALSDVKDSFDDPASAKATAGKLSFDPTLPGKEIKAGSLHPFTQIIEDLNNAFKTLGFETYEGPEISSEGYAFDNLNFPSDHPARESMDTYWLKGSEGKKGMERLCLRPHLTGASVRYMQEHKPPFRFVYPGRVFRSEATDASHERCFYQYEALLVDKDVSFSSGKILPETIVQTIFGGDAQVRMRSGFFPFVEPGFEIDMSCQVCQGKGCSVCSQTGWVEMMPGGPPHPNVLKAGGIDPDMWTGFYINIGLDRLAMMKYGIDDIRLFHSGDLRFLKQF